MKSNKKASKISIGILLLLILSCNNTVYKYDNNQRIVVENYDSTMHLLNRQQFLNDSVKDGYLKEFFVNGKVQHICYYRQNQRDSVEYWYYPNQMVKEKMNYENDLLNGEAIGYYNSGVVSYTVNYHKGKKNGSSYDYFPSGKIEHYYCYDSKGNLCFKRTYDEFGNILLEEGHAIVDVISNKRTYNILVGDSYQAKIITAIPPHEKISLLYHQFRNIGIKRYEKLNKNEYLFTYTPIVTGIYPFRFTLILEDSITNHIDSSYYIDMTLKVR